MTAAPEEPQTKVIAPFDMLPPEMTIAIIKMAVGSYEYTRWNFLVDVIAKISKKFKTLAATKSLWQGRVWITGGDTVKMRKIIQEFLSDGITELAINDSAVISSDEIVTLIERCTKMKQLEINGTSSRMESWPKFITPWTSMKHLVLTGIEVRADVFHDVELHQSLPNLEELWILYCEGVPTGTAIRLPDMAECKSLRRVWLVHQDSKFEVTSFPRSLKKLGHFSSITGIDRAALEEHFDDCDIWG